MLEVTARGRKKSVTIITGEVKNESRGVGGGERGEGG
jgi:hypothetical protein